jgi:dihydrodipicolinate synthase/N-acetylneuraminate lyase
MESSEPSDLLPSAATSAHDSSSLRERLLAGAVIPAHPLALTVDRKLDERHQRALTRYYCAAGAGGIAVGVHTTQFAIRDPQIGLYQPVLQLASDTMREVNRPIIKIAGVCGDTHQAVSEAAAAKQLGYEAALLSLAAWKHASHAELLGHCRSVADTLPLFGFYLQPDVGGRVLDYAFWRDFFEIDQVVAVKIAPFHRYRTLDVIRALADSGRGDQIALYTGNDDNIVADLLSEYVFGQQRLRFAGGLLGHWAVWTQRAVELLQTIQTCHANNGVGAYPILARAATITDMNAALFDVANQFSGCIAGIHAVLVRQGLMAGEWCLDPDERLSPGQRDEIERACRQYPEYTDDEFVREHRDAWLND